MTSPRAPPHEYSGARAWHFRPPPRAGAGREAVTGWNWFKHKHQERGRGEPAVIASMTLAIARIHGIDPKRIYVAGLPPGGAMATIVGAAYPGGRSGGRHLYRPKGAGRFERDAAFLPDPSAGRARFTKEQMSIKLFRTRNKDDR